MSQDGKDSQKEKLRAAIKERVSREEHAFRLVEKMVLLDSVDKEFFINAGTCITVLQYKDVTEERAITKLCGYPLCNNRITQVLKQKYKISLREKKVYDITERKNFCSNKCYKASKYFQSQLSSEPIWMREKTKALQLKLFDDAEELKNDLSGSGEEVLMSSRRNKEGNEQVIGEPTEVNDEHEHVTEEHEEFDEEHNHVDEEHEVMDDGHERGTEEHECVHDKHQMINNDHQNLSLVTKQIGNVRIDLDIDLTDSDDDDIDNIDTINTDQTTDLRKVDSKTFIRQKRCNSLNPIMGEKCKRKEKVLIGDFKTTSSRTSNDEYKIDGISITSDQSAGHILADENRTEDKLARKHCVDKVYHVLLEWCSDETLKYIRDSPEDKGNEFPDRSADELLREDTNGRKVDEKSVTLPSIDSRSHIAIRGKIVSDKLRKAMSPMLSKLSLTMADISSQLTCLLKTFRFTSTNIVLKPAEWTLLAVVLFLVLVKYSPSLTGLLSSRQKHLHSLLSNTIDDVEDVDCLLGVFNFEEFFQSEHAMLDGQQHFDMEVLD